VTYPASGTLRLRSEPALAGAGLILIAGLIYLLLSPQHFAETAYLGTLFLANVVGSVLAAFGIYRGLRWGWALGARFAGGRVRGVPAQRDSGATWRGGGTPARALGRPRHDA
jgi:hypothetical protein